MKYINILFRGRSAQVIDVLIDSFGVLSGIILLLILLKTCSIIKNELEDKERG